MPPVIQFSGILKNSTGQALAGVQGVQFALYSEQEGGAPLWIESQNVAADEYGHFFVLLGSATPDGLPVDLFASGASRWLGVQPQSPGEPEQPRVLLVSVPYALKAADAETIGGLPPSAFVLAADAVTERVKDSGGLRVAAVADGPITAQANSGTAGFIGKFFNTTDLDNSALFQSGSSIGLGTTTPSSALHIQGASNDGITVSNGLNSGVAFLSFKRADGNIAAKVGAFLGTQALVFDAAGTERMRIAPSGYVGIGTASPTQQLHVSSPGSTRMLFQGNAGTTGVIGLDMDSTARKWTLGVKGTDETGAFILFDATASQRRLTVDSSGHFGIGTFTPSTLLDVNGTVTATAFVGDGSLVTNVDAGNVSSGILGVARGGTGVATTGTQGNGTKVQLSTGTTTTNNCVKFDLNGNTVDAGAPCGAVTSLTEGTGIDLTPNTIVATGTVAINTTVVPRMNVANTFTAAQTVSTSTGVAVPVGIDGGTTAIKAVHTATTGLHHAVFGQSDSDNGTGVTGYATAISGDAWGVWGQTDSATGIGVYAVTTGGVNSYGLYSDGNAHVAGDLSVSGNAQVGVDLNVTGNLTKGMGSFKIDHPLDPANKYLYHSFVESPDMMNIYNGIVQLSGQGEATVQLPDWFEALNQDFRYQLTPIGAPGPNLYISEEIRGNSFRIAGGSVGAKVSWQVTGIRHDAFAEAHRIQVEEDKAPEDRGFYLHPEEHGKPKNQGIKRTHRPQKGPRSTAP